MTVQELEMLELPIKATPVNALYVGSALDWMKANTKLEFDKNDIESIAALPDGAKLFLCKFSKMQADSVHVTSESLGGMSRSFSDKGRGTLLRSLASSLIGEYMNSSVKSVPNVSKWK